MKAKDKAKELVYRFLKEFPSTEDIGFGQIKIAKQCALICVDEIIKVLDEEEKYTAEAYWKDVKQEIEKL
jgi:hypothetical protein